MDRGKLTFQFSMMEFILFIAFCFLLVAILALAERDKLEIDMSEYSHIKEVVDKHKGKTGHISNKDISAILEDFFESTVSDDWNTITKAKKQLSTLGKNLSQLTSIITEYKTLQTKKIELLKQLVDNNGTIMKLKQELSSALDKLHYREVEIVKLKSEIITKERQIEKGISALGTCRTQAAIIQEKCGLDKPSCLFSNTGKTAYLANITLKNSSFHIKSINEKETSRLFGSSSNKLNSKKFKKMARIAFNDSKKQPLECRYFVKVIDRTTNKDSYKAQLSTVQEFFYTRLEK